MVATTNIPVLINALAGCQVEGALTVVLGVWGGVWCGLDNKNADNPQDHLEEE